MSGRCIASGCRRSQSCLIACLTSNTTGLSAMRGMQGSESSWRSMVTPQGKRENSFAGLDWQSRGVPVSRLWLRDGLDISEIVEKQGEQAVMGLLAHIEGGA